MATAVTVKAELAEAIVTKPNPLRGKHLPATDKKRDIAGATSLSLLQAAALSRRCHFIHFY
jgi:hypothetical protein